MSKEKLIAPEVVWETPCRWWVALGVCQMEKRERKGIPGRAMEVGMCVVYFGSNESLAGLMWVRKEIRDEARKAA